ncbi:unnamed protein product, partial [Brenthis ino]
MYDMTMNELTTDMTIGYAIAKRLGQEGASVVISSRKEENVQKATANLREDGINAEGLFITSWLHKNKQNMSKDRDKILKKKIKKKIKLAEYKKKKRLQCLKKKGKGQRKILRT